MTTRQPYGSHGQRRRGRGLRSSVQSARRLQRQRGARASACDYSIATDAYLPKTTSRPRFFAALGDYKESASLVTACDYAIAQNTYDAGRVRANARSSSPPSAIIKNSAVSPRRPRQRWPKSCSEAGYRILGPDGRRSSSTPYTMPLMTTPIPPKRFWIRMELGALPGSTPSSSPARVHSLLAADSERVAG